MSSTDDQASTSATATTTTKVRMIVLVSNEGEKFEVEESIAVKESVTIKNSLLDSSSDGDDSQPIVPLPNVNAPMLARIIEYWKASNEESYESMTRDEKKKKWEEEFGQGMEKDEIFEMVLAANYLDCKDLFTVTCQTIAGTIEDMMPEEVRDYFHIDNDFTPEEEAKVRAENRWTFN